MWLYKTGLIVSCFHLTIIATLPTQLTKCQPKDKQCLAQAIESAIQSLANGSKEMGVIPLEPLSISSMTISAGPSAVNVAQIYRNVKIFGLSQANIVDANYNDKELTLEFVQKFNSDIVMEGEYDLKGKILLLPVVGEGPFKIVLLKPTQTHKLKFKETEKHGKRFLEIVDYNLRLQPQRITFAFENLFNGNKELGDALLKTVNDAWDVIYADVGDGYEESFAKIFRSIADQLFSRVPMNDLF